MLVAWAIGCIISRLASPPPLSIAQIERVVICDGDEADVVLLAVLIILPSPSPNGPHFRDLRADERGSRPSERTRHLGGLRACRAVLALERDETDLQCGCAPKLDRRERPLLVSPHRARRRDVSRCRSGLRRAPACFRSCAAGSGALRGGRDIRCSTRCCPSRHFAFVNDERAIQFDAFGQALDMRPDDVCMYAGDREEETPKTEVRSPDGRWAAFVREDNLFVREIATGAERQVTTDGEPYNAYAALPGSSLSAVTDTVIGRPATPALQWSPDSTKFVTYRLDERDVRDMYLLQSVPTDGTARPTLHPYRYPLPGDAHVPLAHLVVVNAARGTIDAAADRTARRNDAHDALRAAHRLVERRQRAGLRDQPAAGQPLRRLAGRRCRDRRGADDSGGARPVACLSASRSGDEYECP